VKTVLKRCLSRGVLAIPAGSHGNVIRVLSPLTIEDDLLERALGVLEEEILRVFATA
jgi:4-aminobutyrate aminotransferase-like enzyme